MHFVYRNNEKDAKGNKMPEQIFLYVEAENMEILQKAPLEELIGETKDHYFRNHFPYISWADDLEKQDVWSDSIGDITRNPQKVANAWWSQKVENRTLRNAGLKYYDASIEGFVPPSNMPIVAGGWYPLPGKPQDVFQNVDIPELTGTIEDLSFLLSIVEKATGATSTQQGVTDQKQITLGEIKLALVEAKERIKGMSKFYTQAWKDRGEMFYKLIEAAPDQIDSVKIYKKGRNTDDIYSREISPKDWQTEAGYRCRVWSQDEKNREDENTLQKQTAVRQSMPDNPKVTEIYQRKLLEWAGYTPDQINEVMEYEQEKRDALMAQLAQQALMGGGQVDQNGQPIPAGGDQLQPPGGAPAQLPVENQPPPVVA